MRYLVLAALAAAAGFGLVRAWHYYATLDGSRRIRLTGCAAIVAAATVCAAALDSRATGSARMDLALRAALVLAAGWGGAVASRTMIGAAAACCAVVVAVAPSSPFAVAAAAGVGAVVALITMRSEQLAFSPFGAMAGASFTLYALDIRGVDTVGVPSVMAACIVVPLILATWAALGRRSRVGIGALVASLVLAGTASTAALAISGQAARQDLDAAVRDARDGLEAAQDPARRTEAVQHLDAASARFHDLDADLGRWWMSGAEYVPVVGRYAHSGRSLMSTGAALVDQARRTVEAVDLERLRPADGRIDLAEVQNVATQLEDARDVLRRAERVVDDAQSPWLVPALERRRTELAVEIDDALASATDGAEGARVAHRLLGADGARRILLLQVTNSESRAIGGWPGSFGVLEANDGALDLVEVGRTGDALVAPRGAPLRLDAPPDFVARYGSEDLTKDVRPLFLTPDLPTSARLLAQAYEQIAGRPIDAVVTIDAYGFAALLRLTGPVDVPGWPQPLTAANAAEVLLFGQYDELGDDRSQFQEAATQVVFDRVTQDLDADADVLLDTLGTQVRQRRIKFFATDAAAQAFFERVDAAGAIGAVRGDFFGLVTQNRVGNKIDWFLHRDVTYDARYDPATGKVESRATITLRNDAPATGLSPLINGSLEGRPTQPGLNRLWFNVYSPLGLVGATLDGRPFELTSQDELGRRVHSAEVSIPAGQTRTIVVELSGELEPGRPYLLDVARQPTVGADALHVQVALTDGWRVSATTGPFAASSDARSAAADIAQTEPLTFSVDARRGG